MIELEKSTKYWWEKAEEQAQKIINLCDHASTHVIQAERESLARMCDQIERYRTYEVKKKIRRFYSI